MSLGAGPHGLQPVGSEEEGGGIWELAGVEFKSKAMRQDEAENRERRVDREARGTLGSIREMGEHKESAVPEYEGEIFSIGGAETLLRSGGWIWRWWEQFQRCGCGGQGVNAWLEPWGERKGGEEVGTRRTLFPLPPTDERLGRPEPRALILVINFGEILKYFHISIHSF